MEYDDELQEIKDFLKLLQGQKGFIFTNYGVRQFWRILNHHENIKELIDKLLIDTSNKELVDKAFELNDWAHIRPSLERIESSNEYLSLCAWIIKKIGEGPSRGDLMYTSTLGIDGNDRERTEVKQYFINTFIEPLVFYLIRYKGVLNNKIKLLKRYQLLCQNYDIEQIDKMGEVDLTQNHLTRFIFNEGINHILSETNVKSGRIDVFNESESIIIEAKIFKGDQKAIYQAISQAKARLENLHFSDAYIVVYNKELVEIKTIEEDGRILDIPYWIFDGKKLFIFIVNLNKELLKPKDEWAKGVKALEISKTEYETVITDE